MTAPVASGVELYIAEMFVHEPFVRNTRVTGFAVLSRSARARLLSRLVCVSPACT